MNSHCTPRSLIFMPDLINHPPHYADRRFEVIDVIEDNIARAPDPISGNHQAQILRYVCRMWDKDNPATNLAKARWYLDRLARRLSTAP